MEYGYATPGVLHEFLEQVEKQFHVVGEVGYPSLFDTDETKVGMSPEFDVDRLCSIQSEVLREVRRRQSRQSSEQI